MKQLDCPAFCRSTGCMICITSQRAPGLTPRPHPWGGNWSCIHQVLFWGLHVFLNSVTPIRCTSCGLHAIQHYSHLLLHVRAIDALPCPNNALPCLSHDMLHPTCMHPKMHLMCTKPFPSSKTGSGGRDYVAHPFCILVMQYMYIQ